MKKTLDSFKKENKSILKKKSLHTVYGGNSSDKGKKVVFWYLPEG
ncbi:hypothetical protein [Tenacibaculum jejuense]|nr:hypothetical protein [Tenacibaculum jejuense]